jgi:hypothetical protein
LHVVTPLGDVGQGMHVGPQALRLFESTQRPPPQRFMFGGHFPSHADASGTHLSTQGLLPAGQEAPHRVPSQVGEPPATPGHGEHETPQ